MGDPIYDQFYASQVQFQADDVLIPPHLYLTFQN